MAEPRSIKPGLRAACGCPLGGQRPHEIHAAVRGAQDRQGARFAPAQGSFAGSIRQEHQQPYYREESKHHAENHKRCDHLLHVIELEHHDNSQANPHPLPNSRLRNRPWGKHGHPFGPKFGLVSLRLSFALLAILDVGPEKACFRFGEIEVAKCLKQKYSKALTLGQMFSAAICEPRGALMSDGMRSRRTSDAPARCALTRPVFQW